MVKAATQKKGKAKPKNRQEQYERFEKAARALGIDDKANAEAFEYAFKQIVPPKRRSPTDR
jgi:hypothetical protein